MLGHQVRSTAMAAESRPLPFSFSIPDASYVKTSSLPGPPVKMRTHRCPLHFSYCQPKTTAGIAHSQEGEVTEETSRRTRKVRNTAIPFSW